MGRVVADAGLSGEVAQGRLALALVDATNPAAPRLAMLNGDRMMYAASMPKVAILLGALAEAEVGRLPINGETVAAMTRMIRFSSNADASRVLRWVGVDRLAEILQSSRFALMIGQVPAGSGLARATGRSRPRGATRCTTSRTAPRLSRLRACTGCWRPTSC